MMQGGAQWKRRLHFAGGALALTGIAFVGMRLNYYVRDINFSFFDKFLWSGVVFSVFAYAASNVFLAKAWWNLLAFSGGNIQWKWALRIFGSSQLAKYIPGNIFHLAGRQALGMAAGLPARSVAWSMAGEIGLIAIVGLSFGILTVPVWGWSISAQFAIGLFIFATISVYFCVVKALGNLIANAMVWQLSFLLVSGGIFCAIFSLISSFEWDTHRIALFSGIYIIAWLLSMVAPGAPAGLGVREVVLIFMLKNYAEESHLLLAAIVVRLVSIVGDFIFFIYCYFIKDIGGAPYLHD